jgi:branched-chain amino acid transport system substrate-binding protein
MKKTLLCVVVAACVFMFGGFYASAEENVLIIGDFQPLSGPGASLGVGVHRGVELAVDDINAQGGITVDGKKYMLKTIVYDHKGTAEGGVTAANKLVFDDGVKYIVGTVGSGPSIAATEAVLTENKVLFATTGWNPKCLGPDRPYNFRLHGTGREYGMAFYEWAAEKLPEAKKVAIIAVNDPAGFAAADDTKAVAESLGMEVVGTEFFERGTTDYYPFLTRLIAKNPDIIDTGGSKPNEDGLMIKQLYELGYKGKIAAAGQVPSTTLEIAGKEAAEGVYLMQTIAYDSPTAAVSAEQKEYAKKYTEKYGDPLVPYQSEKCYDMVIGLVKAIENANSLDTTVVRDELAKTEWKYLSGHMSKWGGEKTYGIKHNLIIPIFINQFQDGKVVTVGSAMPDIP